MKVKVKNMRGALGDIIKMQNILRTGLPERIFVAKYRRLMIKELGVISRENKEEMRKYLVTDTGKQRKANGGKYAGRDTTGAQADGGKMVKSYGVNQATGSYKNGKYVFRLGWGESAPDYTPFQEYGTRSGIKAMNTLMRSQEQIKDIIYQLKAKNNERWSLRDISDKPIPHIRSEIPQLTGTQGE